MTDTEEPQDTFGFDEIVDPGVYRLADSHTEYLIALKSKYAEAAVGLVSLEVTDKGINLIQAIDYRSFASYRQKLYVKCDHLVFNGMLVINAEKKVEENEI